MVRAEVAMRCEREIDQSVLEQQPGPLQLKKSVEGHRAVNISTTSPFDTGTAYEREVLRVLEILRVVHDRFCDDGRTVQFLGSCFQVEGVKMVVVVRFASDVQLAFRS